MGNVFRKFQRTRGKEVKKKRRWFSRGNGRVNIESDRVQEVREIHPETSNQQIVQPTENLLSHSETTESSNQDNVSPTQSPAPRTEALESGNQITVQPTQSPLPQTEAPECTNRITVQPTQDPSPQTQAPTKWNSRNLEGEASFIELPRLTTTRSLQFENCISDSNYTAITAYSNPNGIDELDAIIKRINSQVTNEERTQRLVEELEHSEGTVYQDTVQPPISQVTERSNQDIVQPTEHLLPQAQAPTERNSKSIETEASFMELSRITSNGLSQFDNYKKNSNCKAIIANSNPNDIEELEAIIERLNSQATIEEITQRLIEELDHLERTVHQDTVQLPKIQLPQTEVPTEQNGGNLEEEASFMELSRSTSNRLLPFENYMSNSNYTAITAHNTPSGIEELDAVIKRPNSELIMKIRTQRLVQELGQLRRTGKIEDFVHFNNGEIKRITKKHLLERQRILENKLETNMTEQDLSNLSEFERDRIQFRSTVQFPLNFSNLREASMFVAERIEELGRCPQPQQLINAYRTLAANFKDVLVPDILFLKLHVQCTEFRNYEFLTLCGLPKVSL